MWIGPKKPPIDMMKTWKEKNPCWKYRLWTEKTLEEEFPNGLFNQAQFDEMPEWNGKCDIARYEILKKYGGFFVDADSVCLRPLEDFLLNNDSFSCYEHEIQRGQLIAVGYLGCVKECKLMDKLMLEISKLTGSSLHPKENSAWQTVGPGVLTLAVHKYRYINIAVYPSFYFIPSHYSEIQPYSGPFQPFSEHYWGSCPLVKDFNYEE